MNNRLIKSNDAGGGCTNTVNLYNPFPDSGGVALYQLNGDATDVSGNYDGTATNVTYGTGQFGQAASFNTSNSVLTAPVAFSTNSPYSVSGWVKIANGSTTQSCKLFWKIVGTNQTALQVFYNGDVGSYYFSVTHKFETNGGFGYSFPANDGQWHHYAMTFDGSNANLYIDGANVKSGALDPKLDVGSTNYIGGTSVYNGVTYYSGLDGVDQVRYFTRALRAYEVEALYTEEYCAPTIVPSEHFNTVLYTGTGATNPITGVGFQPDFVWLKKRSGVDDHFAFDSVRGAKSIYPNLTNSEDSFTFSFDSDGFTVPVSGGTNGNGDDFVAWNFKAGGAAVTNTDGTITSQVSANTEAGFSIVSYTGNGVGGATVGHGLGVQPSITIQKNLSNSASWAVLGKVLEDASGGNKRYLLLDTTNAMGAASQVAADSSVIYNWSDSTNNANGNDYIAYCFAEVEGFSKFGSYVGTGTTSGNVVVTGFEPAFVMVKRTDASGGSWLMVDNKRIGTGNEKHELFANTTTAESGGGYDVAFLENGFQMQTTTSNANASGASYIYMAFAADPTTIEPSLEDSFNTVTYTGNGSTQSITGVGFQPDLVWTKGRTVAYDHGIQDSVRGVNSLLYTSLSQQETITSIATQSFDSDGFTYGSNNKGNASGTNYVAWAWKGAELPAINSNGSIPSVVSANPAAGFSIVSYTNTTSGTTDQRYTIGHGLDSAPDLIISKVRNVDGYRWTTYNSFSGAGYYMGLNETRAATAFARAFPVIPSSTVFTLDEAWPHPVNGSAIAYCFHSVAGFSKFGSYTGTGSAGNTVTLGFEPAFVMVKRTDGVQSWGIYDNKRTGGGAGETPQLLANSSGVEYYEPLILTATGFRLDGAETIFNGSGMSYIYMAFANQF